MCDFKPGDEVVCVDASYRERFRPHVRYATEGAIYRVKWIAESHTNPGAMMCGLEGLEWTTRQGTRGGHAVWRFRKVQRRDLIEWLSQSVSNTDKLDKPLPALPKKERV